MNASELRIGNYIIDWTGEVDVLDKDMFYALGCGDTAYSAFKPVPLSEEWLKKFGFNEMMTRKGYFIKPLTIDNKMTLTSEDFIFHLKSGYVYVDFGDIVSQIGIPIVYVHEFQNIYFALTGEELI